jgi:Cu2+-containing amine oxidase
MRHLGLAAALFLAPSLAVAQTIHPLNPLVADEYKTVLSLLRDAGHVSDGTRFPLITLDEPPKAAVWDWTPESPQIPRTAVIYAKDGEKTFVGRVDVTNRKVVSWTEIEGVQLAMYGEEAAASIPVVKADPRWQAAMAKRGITDYEKIRCVQLSTGNFGARIEAERRLTKIICLDGRETQNYWARPIEGVTVVFDMNQRSIIDVIDSGVVPIPGKSDFNPEAVGPLRPKTKPILMVAPEGPNFTTKGRVVTWRNWQFHLKVDARLGPVISIVRYLDQGEWRPVLYQSSLSELFVPYMDPGAGWYFRTYLDVGEFNMGVTAAPLRRGVDCPKTASYMSEVFASAWGRSYGRKDVACVFERATGDVSWRHLDWLGKINETRKATGLARQDQRDPQGDRAGGAFRGRGGQLRLCLRLALRPRRQSDHRRRRHRGGASQGGPDRQRGRASQRAGFGPRHPGGAPYPCREPQPFLRLQARSGCGRQHQQFPGRAPDHQTPGGREPAQELLGRRGPARPARDRGQARHRQHPAKPMAGVERK